MNHLQEIELNNTRSTTPIEGIEYTEKTVEQEQLLSYDMIKSEFLDTLTEHNYKVYHGPEGIVVYLQEGQNIIYDHLRRIKYILAFNGNS